MIIKQNFLGGGSYETGIQAAGTIHLLPLHGLLRRLFRRQTDRFLYGGKPEMERAKR
ncbi:hypothetical protein B4090_1148 [Bacillus licheniformis]|nr:hypothetical protein B4090_1148 [Bacillus licheniformis]